MKPSEFVSKYIGQRIDYDAAYDVQCVDGFKVFCKWAGIPVKATPNNWANGYWIYKDQLGYSQWFDYITDPAKLRDGDWCIWDKGSSCPDSHIAMYYKDQFFGERQGGNQGFLMKDLKKDIMGALRWKGWTMDNFMYGVNYRNFDGADLVVYKGYDGYDLYIISAGEGKLKDIKEFDDGGLLITAAVNAGYFQMQEGQADPYGTHYGVEQSVNGVDLAPKKEGLLTVYETLNDGVGWNTSDKYWYSREEVKFGITPYSILIGDGKQINARSTDYGNKELIANTQTMIARVNGLWFFIESKNQVLPSVMLKYALYIGAEWAFLMDSGGSTQMMAYDAATSSYEPIIYTGRKLPNVAVIAKKKDHPSGDSEPVEGDPQEGGEDTMPEDDVPVDGQDETGEEIPGVPGMSNEVFDALRYCAEWLLPGLAALIITLGEIFGWPMAAKIGAAVAAFSTFLGRVVIAKRKEYNARNGDDV